MQPTMYLVFLILAYGIIIGNFLMEGNFAMVISWVSFEGGGLRRIREKERERERGVKLLKNLQTLRERLEAAQEVKLFSSCSVKLD